MATKFLEPGGDATFNVATTTAGGFWTSTATGTLATDFVNGSHLKSIKYAPNTNNQVNTAAATLTSTGTTISIYIYLNALPTATATFITTTSGTKQFRVRITSAGILQLWSDTAQIGSDGSTLSIGIWYRISLAFTLTSTTINEFRLFINGVLNISVTNATLGGIGVSQLLIGNADTDTTLDFRSSDHYIDNSSTLTDPGNIWVTAKRPNANGTTNGFTTQIGSGGSGYGTGHSPQVNERALSNVNGWSMIGAGSAVTEEYNIESKATGDINISAATIVDWLGWVDINSLAGETIQIILNGANNAQAITSTETLFNKIKGSTTYPAGTGADIGVITDTSLTTVSLYECGVVVAYIPATGHNFLSLLGVT